MISAGKTSSFFSNPVGIGFWAVLAAVLYYNHLALAAGICMISGLLFSASWLWTKYALFKVEIESLSGIQCAFPGNTLSFSCKAANKKLLPLIWLELSFPLSPEGCIAPVCEENTKTMLNLETGQEIPGAYASITWLLWHQEASMEIPMKAVRRGICTVTEVLASSGDILGLGEKEKKLFLASAPVLAVYPAIFPIQANSLIQGTSDMESGKNGYMEDVTLLKMSRPYEPGDSAKKINWRQLARQSRMSVNIYETVFPKLSTFLLDLSSFRKEHTERNGLSGGDITVWELLSRPLEDMISLTASCILELDKRGICCGLIIPGKATEDCILQYPGKHGSSPEELLYSLAALNYQAEDIPIPLWDIAEHFSLFGTLYIVTHSYSSMTVKPDAFAGLGNVAVLARQASAADVTCPFKLFLMDSLRGEEHLE